MATPAHYVHDHWTCESDEALFVRMLYNLRDEQRKQKQSGAQDIMQTIVHQVSLSAAMQRYQRQVASFVREAEQAALSGEADDAADASDQREPPRTPGELPSREVLAREALQTERLSQRLRDEARGGVQLLAFPTLAGTAELRLEHRTSERAYLLWQRARRAMKTGEIAQIRKARIAAAAAPGGADAPAAEDFIPADSARSPARGRSWLAMFFTRRSAHEGAILRHPSPRTEAVPVSV